MKIIFILSIILYQFAEGCTEGYTWANKTRRKENWLICGNFGGGDKGILDYHAWRICESIGIMGIDIISICFGLIKWHSIRFPIMTGFMFRRVDIFIFCGGLYHAILMSKDV